MLCVLIRIAPSRCDSNEQTQRIIFIEDRNDNPKIHLPPYLALWWTFNSSNYPCLEQISMDSKTFEPLKFDGKLLKVTVILCRLCRQRWKDDRSRTVQFSTSTTTWFPERRLPLSSPYRRRIDLCTCHRSCLARAVSLITSPGYFQTRKTRTEQEPQKSLRIKVGIRIYLQLQKNSSEHRKETTCLLLLKVRPVMNMKTLIILCIYQYSLIMAFIIWILFLWHFYV